MAKFTSDRIGSAYQRITKSLVALWLVCLMYALLCAFSDSIRIEVRKTYMSQVGVREATGHNDGPQVESYLASVHRQKGDAWCAAFVNWCLVQNKAAHAGSGWSPAWFPSVRIIYLRGSTPPSGGRGGKTVPQPGDVFGLYFASYHRIAHVGFIDSWGEKQVITVEGNTSDANSGEATREGQGVYKKKRLTRQIYAVANWIDR